MNFSFQKKNYISQDNFYVLQESSFTPYRSIIPSSNISTYYHVTYLLIYDIKLTRVSFEDKNIMNLGVNDYSADWRN